MVYSSVETAKILQISPSYLRRMTMEGTIRSSARTSNGHARYTIRDIQRARQMLGHKGSFIPPSSPPKPVEPPVDTTIKEDPPVTDGGLGRIFV